MQNKFSIQNKVGISSLLAIFILNLGKLWSFSDRKYYSAKLFCIHFKITKIALVELNYIIFLGS